MLDYNITVLTKPGNPYYQCVESVYGALFYALIDLGYRVELSFNWLNPKAKNILFGLHDLPEYSFASIPKGTIIYNLEQISPGTKGMRPHYLNAMQEFEVWDYSQRNIEKLRENHSVKNIQYVPLGYIPQMTCIEPSYPKDIDVLFYGYLNERRIAIIEQLQQKGINAVGVEKVFGKERDFLIARSKLVMNIHYYVPGIIEIGRLNYLMANKKAILSERNANTEMHDGYEDACFYVPYEKLVSRAVELLESPAKLEEQAEKGFEIFASHDYAQIIKSVVGLPTSKLRSEQFVPYKLNIGSSEDFRLGYLNIDINEKVKPDVCIDISQAIDFSHVHNVPRFGKVCLKKGYFSKILANNLLTRVFDINQAMKNFLELLCEDGELHITVPYYLSCSAWENPLTIRCFNEKSWELYTTQAWKIGWSEYRFEIKDMSFNLSGAGRLLHSQKRPVDEIIRIPGSVDSMELVLRKHKNTAEELLQQQMKLGLFYNN